MLFCDWVLIYKDDGMMIWRGQCIKRKFNVTHSSPGNKRHDLLLQVTGGTPSFSQEAETR